jgi:hypothetical protein
VAVRRVVVAEHRQRPQTVMPGVSAGTRIIDCCACAARRVGLAHEDETLQRGSPAPEVHHLRPLIT